MFHFCAPNRKLKIQNVGVVGNGRQAVLLDLYRVSWWLLCLVLTVTWASPCYRRNHVDGATYALPAVKYFLVCVCVCVCSKCSDIAWHQNNILYHDSWYWNQPALSLCHPANQMQTNITCLRGLQSSSKMYPPLVEFSLTEGSDYYNYFLNYFCS